jgi:hypothetical protein
MESEDASGSYFIGDNELTLRRIAGISLLVAGHMLYSGQSSADTWQSTVTSRASTEFDSNPAMSPTHTYGVWRALFEPGYMVMRQSGEDEIRAGLSFQIERSSNKTVSPDRDSPGVFADWLRQSEVGEFGISARYAEFAARNAGVDATGLAVILGTRATSTLSGKWSRELSERSTLEADAVYESIAYKGGTYVDYSTQSGSLKYSYALSESIKPFIRAKGDKYVPTGGGSSSNFTSVAAGFNWKVESVDWTMHVGRSKSSNGHIYTLGAVAALYTGQRTILTVNASREVLPSGLSGLIRVDQTRMGWIYTLSEFSNFGIDWERWRNRNIDSRADSMDVISTTKSVWLESNLNPSWKMRTYYLQRVNKAVGVNGVSSRILGLSFGYSLPDF